MMSDQTEEKMEVEVVKEEDRSDEPDTKADEKAEDGEKKRTPKRRSSSLTLTEKRLNRLSSGMEMRGMMTESYQCQECKASFSRKSKLDYHIANTHPKEEPPPPPEPVSRRGRKPKTPKKGEKQQKTPSKPPKQPRTPKTPKTPKEMKEMESAQTVIQRIASKYQSGAISKQPKVQKVTNISNEKVRYNWGYYCTSCDMYFANMFAQQFHCLHGQAKFRCEACCICFKLRKNFMSHVQMVHGVDIPEEVLARMRPRSEIRAKQEADAEKSAEKKSEKDAQSKDIETVDLTKDDASSNTETSSKGESSASVANEKVRKHDRNGAAKIDSSPLDLSKLVKSGIAKTLTVGEADEVSRYSGNEKGAESPVIAVGREGVIHSGRHKKDTHIDNRLSEQISQSKQRVNTSKESDKEAPDVILISDSPSSNKNSQSKIVPMQAKGMFDIKQSGSGGNSSADEGDKKDEGRVYLTTVRMGNTYVTLPSGEKWMIECLRCHQAFFKMEDASSHMKQRAGSHFSCPHCYYSSTLFSQCDYEIHRLRTHSFPCAQCRQSFILECQRDMHEQKIHNYHRQLMKKKPNSVTPGVQRATSVTVHAAVKGSMGKVAIAPTPVIVQTGSRPGVNKDAYPVVRAQRTPYVCLLCDRDCYTRDALDHHKKTFHSGSYRPGIKQQTVIKNAVIYKHPQQISGKIKGTSAPVSKILEEMRSPKGAAYSHSLAMQNPYLEPNKVPQAYITRIKVDLPEANKLVNDIRKELLKGPSNFAMPNYARPSKFNKDMVTNPNVVRLSREVAYKLYFDLQGPCNDSDKMNYKSPEDIRYKIPMGCHSQKLKDIPLFPTLKDIEYRTQNYQIPPLNLMSPAEIFANFSGGLSMKESVDFAHELDNFMFGCVSKTMRALSMVYSTRRVAVSEGFWRLQTKALIAILKEIEDQRKAQIAERAKAASEAARAAIAAAASARPVSLKLGQQPVPVVDLVQQSRSVTIFPNGSAANDIAGISNLSTPMIQLVQGPTSSNPVNLIDSPVKSLIQPEHTNGEPVNTNASTSPTGVPSLRHLARKAARKNDAEKQAEERGKIAEPDAGTDEEKEKEKVVVNGNASPPCGEGSVPVLNGANHSPGGGSSPTPGTTPSGNSRDQQPAPTEGTMKGSKTSNTGGNTSHQAYGVPNGTVHASLPGAAPAVGGGTGGIINTINLGASGINLISGMPIQLRNVGTNGSVNTVTNGVIRLGNGLGSFSGGSGGGVTIPRGGFISAGSGGSLVLSLAPNQVPIMSVPKLANSVGAVSAVASAPVAKQVLLLNNASAAVNAKPVALSIAKPVPHQAGDPAQKPQKVIPESVAQFIKRSFISIKPKQSESCTVEIPIKVERLPPEAGKKTASRVKISRHPHLATLLKLKKPLAQTDQQTEGASEDSLLSDVLQTIAILQSSHILPDDLCKKINPLCEKIALPSTSKADREVLFQEVDAILRAESKDVLNLVEGTKDMNENNAVSMGQKSAGDLPADSSSKAITKFLNGLAQRIKSIQSKLTNGSLDLLTFNEVVPLCQNICNPKWPLSRKVRCIAEIETKIRVANEDVEMRSEAATPVDIATVPTEVLVDDDADVMVDEDADVYFKLQLEGGGVSVMVNMNDMELALEAIDPGKRLVVRVKRLRESDAEEEASDSKLRKVEGRTQSVRKDSAGQTRVKKASREGKEEPEKQDKNKDCKRKLETKRNGGASITKTPQKSKTPNKQQASQKQKTNQNQKKPSKRKSESNDLKNSKKKKK
ncbi:uncharacterized protein [Diadema antillarum]|uniref:uncharacterized protein n=1 Tax=Diadema antillarum TaxID=105358 RepID=UPI003A8B74A7